MKKMRFLAVALFGLLLLGPVLASADTTYTFWDNTLVQGWVGHNPVSSSSGWYQTDIIASNPNLWDIKKVDVTLTDDGQAIMQIYTNYKQAGEAGAGQADIALDLNRDGKFESGIFMQGANYKKLVTGVSWALIPENQWAQGGNVYGGRVWSDATHADGIPLTRIGSYDSFLENAFVSYEFLGGLSTWLITVKFTSPGDLFGFEVSSGSCANETIVVPLPSTLLLMGSGLLGLAGLGWRRTRKEN